MKRSMIVAVSLVAVMLMAGLASANVFLNDVDYGTNFKGALTAATNSGDIIEFRDNGSYSIAGQNHLACAGITVRSAEGFRATILATDGGTNSTFMLEAANITFQNLNITGNVVSGTYAFGFFGTKDSELNYPASGLTIADVDFLNVRAVIDAGSGWVQNLTFVDNTVTNTHYGLGKSGMNYGGGVVITGNTFVNNGVGTAQPNLWIEKSKGSLMIDGNTFSNYNGQYAIYSLTDLSANPITLGTNDFGTGIGGSGAPYELYPLNEGGYAVGLLNSTSVPEPATMSLLALGALTLIRRRIRK